MVGGQVKRFTAGTECLISLLSGPKSFEELTRLSKKSPKHVLYRVIAPLEARGIIRKTSDNKYALSILFSDLDDIVNSALSQFKEEGFEQLSLNYLANKIGRPPKEIEESVYRLAPNHGLTIEWESRKRGLWNNVKFQLEQAGGVIEKFSTKKFLLTDKRDETGWYKSTFQEKKDEVNGILILQGATELISTASKLGIHLLRKYEGNLFKYGIFLTTEKLDTEDRLWQNDSLFVVKEVEKRFEGTDLRFYVVHACEVYVEHE